MAGAVSRTIEVLVNRMGSNTVFCDPVHVARSDLQFDPLP